MKSTIFLICVCFITTVAQPASAQVSGAKEIVKAIAKYLAKETGGEATEQAVKKMTREVGEELIERTAQKVVREGGEKALLEVSELVAKNGPNVIRALDNAPDPEAVLRLLKELPADDVAKVASRLAAGSTGKELAALSTNLGTNVLRAEAKHPGIGFTFATALGNDGAELSLKLSTDQALQIGKHVDDIAKLPAGQQSQLIYLITNNADRFTAFVGRFVEKNPGKVLFTGAGAILILAEPERFLGGDEIIFDENGNPTVVSKPGLIGRTGQEIGNAVKAPVQWTLYLLGGIVAIAVSLIAGSKVLKCIRKDHSETQNETDKRENRTNKLNREHD